MQAASSRPSSARRKLRRVESQSERTKAGLAGTRARAREAFFLVAVCGLKAINFIAMQSEPDYVAVIEQYEILVVRRQHCRVLQEVGIEYDKLRTFIEEKRP